MALVLKQTIVMDLFIKYHQDFRDNQMTKSSKFKAKNCLIDPTTNITYHLGDECKPDGFVPFPCPVKKAIGSLNRTVDCIFSRYGPTDEANVLQVCQLVLSYVQSTSGLKLCSYKRIDFSNKPDTKFLWRSFIKTKMTKEMYTSAELLLLKCFYSLDRISLTMHRLNMSIYRAVVVAKLAEPSLPPPEVCRSNPVIGSFYWTNISVNL